MEALFPAARRSEAMPQEASPIRGSTMTLSVAPVPAALIFDLEGVLVDSEPLHKRAKELRWRGSELNSPLRRMTFRRATTVELDIYGESRQQE